MKRFTLLYCWSAFLQAHKILFKTLLIKCLTHHLFLSIRAFFQQNLLQSQFNHLRYYLRLFLNQVWFYIHPFILLDFQYPLLKEPHLLSQSKMNYLMQIHESFHQVKSLIVKLQVWKVKIEILGKILLLQF